MTVYRAGNFAVPGGTGNVTVQLYDDSLVATTEVPHTIIFFGTNSGTEDTLVSMSNPSMFMGMMAREASGSWQQRVNSFRMDVGYSNRGDCCIYSITGASLTAEYQASAVSSGAGTFTVNFSSVVASRIVHYVAVCDSIGYDSIFLSAYAGTSAQTVTEDFPARSAFGISGYAYDGGGVNYSGPDFVSIAQGGWSYPDSYAYTESDSVNLSMGDFSTSSQRYEILYNDVGGVVSGYMGHAPTWGSFFIGPFLGPQPHFAYPTDATHFHADFSGFGDSALVAPYSGDTETGGGTPSEDLFGAVHENMNRKPTTDMVLSFGALNWAVTPGSVAAAATGGSFGIWTPSYQGSAAITHGGYLYQSRNKSWISGLDSSGVVAGTIDRNDPGFDYVTQVSSTTSNLLVWWGAENDTTSGTWRPQIYRRLPIRS